MFVCVCFRQSTRSRVRLRAQEEVFLTIARQAALEAAQAGSGGPKKGKELPCFTTCLKATLLGLTLPVSIFFCNK